MNLKNKIIDLKKELEDILENAPKEENCTDEENDIYADIKNLIESIDIFLEGGI